MEVMRERFPVTEGVHWAEFIQGLSPDRAFFWLFFKRRWVDRAP